MAGFGKTELSELPMGIGTDIESIDRFRGRENDARFLAKIFTRAELDYCLPKARPEQHLAARFCGKEACIKAVAQLTGKRIGFKAVEILSTEGGSPAVRILRKGFEGVRIQLSLSHCHDKAIAFALASKSGD